MKLTEMIKLGSKGFKPADIKELEGSGVQTDDVIKLAENGYSVTDVKELITLAGKEESLQPGNDGTNEPSGPKGNTPGNDGADGKDDNKEMEALKKEYDELKRKLAALQDQVASKNLGGQPKDPRDDLREILKSIY